VDTATQIETRDAPGVMTGKPLIESDRVEGTSVYDPKGNNLGSIKRLMIDKKSPPPARYGAALPRETRRDRLSVEVRACASNRRRPCFL
jgi:hypothetical protein